MLSIYEMHDSALDYFEGVCVKEAMLKFKETFPERLVHLYGARTWSDGLFSSADWYVKVTKKVFTNGRKNIQLDVDDLLKLLESDPWQKNDPHIVVFITSRDLTKQSLDYCFGMTRGVNTVQSVFRYKDSNPEERKAKIQSAIFSELTKICDSFNDCQE